MTIRMSLISGLPKLDEYPEFISKCMKALNISFDTKHNLDEGVHNFDLEIKVFNLCCLLSCPNCLDHYCRASTTIPSCFRLSKRRNSASSKEKLGKLNSQEVARFQVFKQGWICFTKSLLTQLCIVMLTDLYQSRRDHQWRKLMWNRHPRLLMGILPLLTRRYNYWIKFKLKRGFKIKILKSILISGGT